MKSESDVIVTKNMVWYDISNKKQQAPQNAEKGGKYNDNAQTL